MVVWSVTGEAPGDVTPDVSDDVTLLPVGVTHECTTGEAVQVMAAVHADLLHERLQGSASEGEVCRALHPWAGDMCAWGGDDVAQEVGQSDPEVAPELPTIAEDACVEELGEDSSLVSMRGAGAGEGQGCGAERAAWTCADVFKWLAGLFLIVLVSGFGRYCPSMVDQNMFLRYFSKEWHRSQIPMWLTEWLLT
jgi:hypothetical protein